MRQSFRICQKLICTFKYCGFDGFFILFISNNCLTLLRFLRSLSNFLGLGQRPKNTTDALLFLWKSSPNLVLRHIVPTSESKSFFVEVQQNVSRSSYSDWLYFFLNLGVQTCTTFLEIRVVFFCTQEIKSSLSFFKAFSMLNLRICPSINLEF